MRSTAFLILLFAVVALAGVAEAQHGRIYIATDAGVYVPAVQSGELPVLELSAGQPIRVRIHGPRGSGKTMAASMLAKMTRIQIPCGAGGGSSGAPQEQVLSKAKSVYTADAPNSWKGSCSILSVRVGDGAEHRVRAYFR